MNQNFDERYILHQFTQHANFGKVRACAIQKRLTANF